MKTFFTHPAVSTGVKVLLSAGLLAAVTMYVDFRMIALSFAEADPFFIAAGVALAFLQIVIHFFRWRYILRIVDGDMGNYETWMSLFVGFTAGFFTPVQLGEFAGRIASHPGTKKSHVIGLTIIDKLYMMAVAFLFGGTGLVLFAEIYFPEYWHPFYRYLVMAIDAAIIVLCLTPGVLQKVLFLLPQRIREHRLYNAIHVIERDFSTRAARTVFLYTASIFTVIFLEFYFLVNAFGSVSLIHSLLSIASIFFVKTFVMPFSFGDIGVRESASVFFLGHVGAAASVAFNASLVMSFLNVLVPVAIGALFVLRMKKQR